MVDCSGRRTAAPTWLEKLGYRPPTVEQVEIDLRYATRHYRLPDDVLGDDLHVLIGPTADLPAGGVVPRIEDDRWVTTLFGMCGTRPALDPDGFEAFAERLPARDIAEALRQGTPLDDPARFRYPASRRHRYERLCRLPAGLLMAGDAVCSFNPIYGQGMTVAALQGATLQQLLATDGVPSARRWFAAITPTIDIAWDLARGSDLSVRCVPARRSPTDRLQHAYLRSFQAAACHDARLTARFWQVVGLVEPPASLLRPAVSARVVRSALDRGVPRPGVDEPGDERTIRKGPAATGRWPAVGGCRGRRVAVPRGSMGQRALTLAPRATGRRRGSATATGGAAGIHRDRMSLTGGAACQETDRCRRVDKIARLCHLRSHERSIYVGRDGPKKDQRCRTKHA